MNRPSSFHRRWAAWTALYLSAALGAAAWTTGGPPPAQTPASATNPPLAEPLPKPEPLRQIGPGLFQLGKVTLDKPRRAVSFPAEINQTEGTIEYVVVTRTGKTHESVLRTPAQPQDIHLAMLLLGVHAANTNQFPPGLSVPPPGDKVRLEVCWKDGTTEKRLPAEDLVLNKETGQSLSRGEWVYNGSNISEGAFVAQRDGSIVSTRIDPDALINNPRRGRENEDLYAVNTKALPPAGRALEVVVLLP